MYLWVYRVEFSWGFARGRKTTCTLALATNLRTCYPIWEQKSVGAGDSTSNVSPEKKQRWCQYWWLGRLEDWSLPLWGLPTPLSRQWFGSHAVTVAFGHEGEGGDLVNCHWKIMKRDLRILWSSWEADLHFSGLLDISDMSFSRRWIQS